MRKKANEEKIIALKKALLKRKYFSILLALFTLGVNIFAWFVFTTTAQLGLDATVAAWDVQFRDDSDQAMQSFVIDITKMKPGMDDFTKTISVYNRSDVDADFIYEVLSFDLLGHHFETGNSNDMINNLKSNYPFLVTFNASKNILNASDEVQFDVSLTWPYETNEPHYYKQDDVYNYESSLSYYRYLNNIYSLYNVPDVSTYNSNKTSLYLDKDDADTYFGMKCHEYEESTDKACLSLNVRLLVQQRNN